MGFGLVLLGILISSSKKEVLSNNVSGIFVPLGDSEDPRENLTLVQGVKMDMGRYHITYEKDSLVPKKERTYFNIRFSRKDGKEEFCIAAQLICKPGWQRGIDVEPRFKTLLGS